MLAKRLARVEAAVDEAMAKLVATGDELQDARDKLRTIARLHADGWRCPSEPNDGLADAVAEIEGLLRAVRESADAGGRDELMLEVVRRQTACLDRFGAVAMLWVCEMIGVVT